MKTILIADDEPLARQVFKTMVARNFTDVAVVAEAENGQQAYELACEKRPDLIAMDIKMPVLNGLDASRAILNAMPDAQIIILTAYDCFDYIREAFELGVKGYLLKPIQAESMVEKVNHIFQCVAAKKTAQAAIEKSGELLHAARRIVEKELISAYMSGENARESIEYCHNFLQVSIQAGYFISIFIQPALHASAKDNIRLDILKSKAVALATEVFQLGEKIVVGSFSFHILPVFVPVEARIDAAHALREGTLLASEAVRKITVVLRMECCAGIGRIYRDPTDFHHSYAESVSVLAVPEMGRVLVFSQHKTKLFTYPYQLETQLINQILIGDTANIVQTADQIIHAILTSGCTFSRIKEYVFEFFVVIRRTISGLGVDFNQLDADVENFQIENIRQPEDLNCYISNGMRAVHKALEAKDTNHNIGLVHKIQRYLAEEDISMVSLESLATGLSLSVQYVSKIFKEEFGKNFIDYVTSCKIERAKALLLSRGKTIGEVAAAVGYHDPNYFCRIFKRVTGMTPMEFRKMA